MRCMQATCAAEKGLMKSRCVANVANANAMLDVLLAGAAWCHCPTHACTAQRPIVNLPQAKAYLTAALRASAPLRIGGGPSRPLNHGYQTADWTAAGSSGQRQQEGRRLAPSRLQLYAVTDAACDARQVTAALSSCQTWAYVGAFHAAAACALYTGDGHLCSNPCRCQSARHSVASHSTLAAALCRSQSAGWHRHSGCAVNGSPALCGRHSPAAVQS